MKYLFLSLAIACTILFLCLRLTKGGLAGLFSKTLASFAFVALGLFGLISNSSNNNLAGLFLLLGLIAGFVGDIVLDLKVIYPEQNNPYLNAGMLSFGVGHIFYFVSALLISNFYNLKLLVPLLVAGICGVIFAPAITFGGKKLMGLDFGKFVIQTLTYTFELVFMSALLVCLTLQNTVFLLFTLGIILIFVSDLFLSMNYFKEGQSNNKLIVLLNHIIYYAGQILIALFLFII